MFRLKGIFLLVLLFAACLSACAPGIQNVPPPNSPLGTDIAQQATALPLEPPAQTAVLPTPTPVSVFVILPSFSNGLKPADSEAPASGVCGDAYDDPVFIILGIGPDGLPLAGRCIRIMPAQRIKFVNQSGTPFNMSFAGYQINLLVGAEILLDQPVGQYLALGVHFLNMGPELWVKDSAAATAPPPIVEYNNAALGYKLNLLGDWNINETNNTNKEVIFSPPYADPAVVYLSVKLDIRPLDEIINSYAQMNATREDTTFYGSTPALKFTFPSGSCTYVIPYGNQTFEILTDKPNDGLVQSILMTFRFIAPPQSITYDATMADNGRTFVMNIGDKIRINFDYSYGWSMISDFNPGVLMGAGDGYFAIASGNTTLTMIGNPECLGSIPPCGLPSIMFTIMVIVN